MCLGIPMQVRSITGIAAQVSDGAREETVDISLLERVHVGDWVLTFLGTAREVLDPKAAAQIRSALEGLASVMAGGDVGDAFADLDARTPSLPPHLEAARLAGQSSG